LEILRQVAAIPELSATHTVETLAWDDYREARAALELFELPADMSGCVLDVGCGLGGKTAYYAESGARLMIGLEMDGERARVASVFADAHPSGSKVHIVIGDAAHIPFRTALFDTVISTDTWEHLAAPAMALLECARVVRGGGTVAISAVPYYSPWGAHAWSWLPLPWIQVILPRRCLFGLMAWIERRRRVNIRRPSAVRLDWTRSDEPVHARRLTVAALKRNLPLDRMKLLRFTIVPVGARYGSVAARVMGALVRLPLLRELLAGMMVVVMRRILPAG
jgi:SAM-dependent methyltransferase